MKKLVLLGLLLLAGTSWAKPMDGFPPDPKGAVICDRLYETVTLNNKDYNLYACVSKSGTIEIYSGQTGSAGVEWRKLYTWKNNRDLTRSVLKVASHGDQEIQFWLQEHFAYVEGRATSVLHYTPATGKFEEQLSD